MMRKGTDLVWKQWFYCPRNMYTGVMLTHDLYLFLPTQIMADKVSRMLYEGRSAIEVLESVTSDGPHFIRIGNVNSLTHNVELLKDGDFFSSDDEF